MYEAFLQKKKTKKQTFSNSAEKASITLQVKRTWGKLAAWICDKDKFQVG